MELKMKNRNFVAKNMGVNKGGAHRDKKNDYKRSEGKVKHGCCMGVRDEYNGDYDCLYNTSITCDECKYGPCGGRKDPAAKCNQL